MVVLRHVPAFVRFFRFSPFGDRCALARAFPTFWKYWRHRLNPHVKLSPHTHTHTHTHTHKTNITRKAPAQNDGRVSISRAVVQRAGRCSEERALDFEHNNCKLGSFSKSTVRRKSHLFMIYELLANFRSLRQCLLLCVNRHLSTSDSPPNHYGRPQKTNNHFC